MHGSKWQHPLLIWAGWILLAAFLKFGPASFSTRLNQTVLDLVGQSLNALNEGVQSCLKEHETAPADETKLPVQMKDAVLLDQNRDLQMLVAQLRQDNERLRGIPIWNPATPIHTLLNTTPVQAAVLGEQGALAQGTRKVLVALGSRQGLVGNELILQGNGLLIDQGAATLLAPDQLVAVGRSLFGRTVAVGRWTSVVQPITAPEFRTSVQLVRESEFGTVLGARGILKGTGEGCEVIEVIGTAAVAVGDLVYTYAGVLPTATPIYCGRVTSATIAPNAPHWTILVSPGHAVDSLPTQVTVLRTELELPPGSHSGSR